MINWMMNLQRFADAGTLVNATGNYMNAYTGEATSFVPGVTDLSTLNKTFTDTALLDNARDKLIFTQLGKKLSLPANKGTSMELRRWKTLGRISKLTLQRKEQTVCNYDRGWDVKPVDEETQIALEILLQQYN